MRMKASVPVNRESAAMPVAKIRKAVAHTVTYLRDRQSPNGGFCFYRWQGLEEPSLGDTRHALATLRLLDAEIPRRAKVVAFLHGFEAAGFDGFYCRLLALAALDAAMPPDARSLERIRAFDAAAVLADEHVPTTARLERTLRIVTLQRCFDAIAGTDEIVAGVRALCRDGGWGDKPNLGDTRLALEVLAACGARASTDVTRRFVDATQIASFGFTATVDSRYTTLDVVHAGLRACTLLGWPVRYMTDALDFVLGCQGDNGGFARTPDALPGIDLTHRAVLALVAAGALPAGSAVEMQVDSGV
jgi:hypothetical protein